MDRSKGYEAVAEGLAGCQRFRQRFLVGGGLQQSDALTLADRSAIPQREQSYQRTQGSVDIYFGPKAPAGYENNWVQTIPGKGWFILFRLDGPLEPWFDNTCKLPDIENVQ